MALGSTSLTVGAAVSILVSGWAAGVGTGLSLLGTPSILHAGAPSEVMVRQWKFQFLRGRAMMPALGALNAVNFWAVAYGCWSRGLEWRGFAVAGLSTCFSIPYTLAFMMGVNNKLLAAAEGRDKMLSDDSARGLIRQWGDLNITRAVFLILGTGLALWNFCL
ncbi:hypothetical protein F4802DRAFT_542567 [Xylaria palmicola]|nr:hypothetical protein F4802DRAFT_542567 [Xylaria palmicola]